MIVKAEDNNGDLFDRSALEFDDETLSEGIKRMAAVGIDDFYQRAVEAGVNIDVAAAAHNRYWGCGEDEAADAASDEESSGDEEDEKEKKSAVDEEKQRKRNTAAVRKAISAATFAPDTGALRNPRPYRPADESAPFVVVDDLATLMNAAASASGPPTYIRMAVFSALRELGVVGPLLLPDDHRN